MKKILDMRPCGCNISHCKKCKGAGIHGNDRTKRILRGALYADEGSSVNEQRGR